MVKKMDDNIKFLKRIDQAAQRYFGKVLPKIVSRRLKEDLRLLENPVFAQKFYIALALADEARVQKMTCLFRSSFPNLLISFLAEITALDPLPAYYGCKRCGVYEFHPEVQSFETLDKKNCPKCGLIMTRSGWNLPHEVYFSDKTRMPDLTCSIATGTTEKFEAIIKEKLQNYHFYKACNAQNEGYTILNSHNILSSQPFPYPAVPIEGHEGILALHVDYFLLIKDSRNHFVELFENDMLMSIDLLRKESGRMPRLRNLNLNLVKSINNLESFPSLLPLDILKSTSIESLDGLARLLALHLFKINYIDSSLPDSTESLTNRIMFYEDVYFHLRQYGLSKRTALLILHDMKSGHYLGNSEATEKEHEELRMALASFSIPETFFEELFKVKLLTGKGYFLQLAHIMLSLP